MLFMSKFSKMLHPNSYTSLLNSLPKVGSSRGFTIVELLIVIVIIAILAAITIVSFNGLQVRARDNMRTDITSKIKRALEVYKIDNGRYPGATANPGNGGWEMSNDVAGSFMEYLVDSGFPSGTPVDPINSTTFRFWYYRYAAGSNGCDPARGGFYVLRIVYENASVRPIGNSMVSECTSPQAAWSDPGTGSTYVFHAYEN